MKTTTTKWDAMSSMLQNACQIVASQADRDAAFGETKSAREAMDMSEQDWTTLVPELDRAVLDAVYADALDRGSDAAIIALA